MRLAGLTLLVLVAFASNSLLNRLALAGGEAGAADFAALRLVSGAVALVAMVWLSGARVPWGLARRPVGAAAMVLYILGFSFAYLTLDAGVGALILFGVVQITMFGGGLWAGERPGPRRWAGAFIAFGGLAWLCWPAGAVRVDLGGAFLMAAAGLGWGIYSLVGRGGGAPLPATAANFTLAVPPVLALWLVLPGGVELTGAGVALAVISGVVTSGIGYALWYTVLPQIEASVAALLQLLVPVIAALGGILFLAEPLTARAIGAAVLVLGGIALGIARAAPKTGGR